MTETVKCFHCDRKVRLGADGRYAKHGPTRQGVITRECSLSGRVHERHSGSFRIVTRNPTRWLCECLCGETFIEDTYDAVDAVWLSHRKAEKAVAS